MNGAGRVGLAAVAFAVVAAAVATARVVRRPEASLQLAAPRGATTLQPAGDVAGEVHGERVLPSLPVGASEDEARFMDQLRSIEDSDPDRALEWAREGSRRFPAGAAAAERAKIVVKSLARQGRLAEARGEAEEMVNRYAGTPWALEVEMHTGAHPHTDRVRP